MRVALFHGFEHHRPQNHWMWILAEELRTRRVPVQYPQFPQPDRPDAAEWQELARAELAMMGDGERVVIAHSLGCVLWGSILPDLPENLLPTRVLLVAPPAPAVIPRVSDDFARLQFGGFDRVPTTVVARKDDPYRPITLANEAALFGVPSVELPGRGHLDTEDGHGPWPSALDWVLTGNANWALGPQAWG